MTAYMPTKAAQEDWTTAEEELAIVRRVFGGGIDFDPCSNPMGIVGAEREVMLPKWNSGTWDWAPGRRERVIFGDGLDVKWNGSTFVNPAYNAKALSLFLAKAAEESRRGVPVIVLTKVKTGIRGWRPAVQQAAAVAYADHRLTFGGGDGSNAPFDCCMVLFTQSRTLINRFALEFESWGDVQFHVGAPVFGRAA